MQYLNPHTDSRGAQPQMSLWSSSNGEEETADESLKGSLQLFPSLQNSEKETEELTRRRIFLTMIWKVDEEGWPSRLCQTLA